MVDYTIAQENFIAIARWLDPFFFSYFFIINFVYLLLLIFGTAKIINRNREVRIEDYTALLQSNSLPTISFLVPFFNEDKDILLLVDNLLNLNYLNKEIILINDGSTDKSFEIICEKLDLVKIPIFYSETIKTKLVKGVYKSQSYPEVILIDKENGRKFDALNAALNACKTPFYVTVDADTFINDKDFEALIRPLLTYPELVAVGASVRIKNGCTLDYNRVVTDNIPKNFITGMQSIEYLRSFLLRQGWDYMGGNFVIAGAFSIFSTEVIKKLQGYKDTVADDVEIIMRLNRILKKVKKPFKIMHLPDPAAWTEGPETIKSLGHQRMLWQRGTLESIWYHKELFFNSEYGAFGNFSFPFLVLGDAMECLIELLGYVYILTGLFLGVIILKNILILLALVWGFTVLFTLFCLFVEEFSFSEYPKPRSIFLLFLYSFLENLGYRQLTLLWRLNGFFKFIGRYKEIKRINKEINDSVNTIIKKRIFG